MVNDNLTKGVFSVRNIEDAKKIESSIKKEKNVSIIGAGLIGLEMADNLKIRGLSGCTENPPEENEKKYISIIGKIGLKK